MHLIEPKPSATLCKSLPKTDHFETQQRILARLFSIFVEITIGFYLISEGLEGG